MFYYFIDTSTDGSKLTYCYSNCGCLNIREKEDSKLHQSHDGLSIFYEEERYPFLWDFLISSQGIEVLFTGKSICYSSQFL
jgi:hypothetical protein